MSRVLFVFLLAIAGSFDCAGWGSTGHNVVGGIADKYLDPKVRVKLNEVLRGETLATAGSWMDDIRSNRKFGFMDDWHWVTIPDGIDYDETEKNPRGDIINAIEKAIQRLKSKTLSRDKELEALKILVHLVADLHQPLHVGTGLDRGGNETRVKWMGRKSNLHRVWDSDLIDETGMSDQQLVSSIQTPTKREISRIKGSPIRQWAIESMSLREKLYNIGDGNLGQEYYNRNLGVAKRRLLEAGIRLAAVLNDIYG